MAPNQSEKKLIADKVAKVREVVDNATTNDIVMVLHSFDLDVNKTIQAFCEDGAASILGDWVTSSGVSVAAAKKKKNKKSKGKSAAATETPSTATTDAVPPAAKSHVAPEIVSKPQAVAQKTTGTPAAAVSSDPLSTAFNAIRLALNDREKALKATLSANPKAQLSLDATALLNAISSFGTTQKLVANGKPSNQPKSVPQTTSPAPAAPIKHATSQSSITSSVGADSGVNLSPTHKEEKKAPAKKQTVVSAGGFQMSSEGLSADQLSALQQSLAMSLAARGLDTSVLTSSENISRRPRPNKGDNKKGGNQGKQHQKEQPKLSIL
ncbi:unnamed protein product [Caenorhabditis bovis]|uniref:Uncharacterized protein n=1 Tax=Caenorhabditis bovis TaxID=2654633 RepID=A0A8S1F4X0_9PELO|nr:unnamed protein product [Caenorhabditis bovis]